VIASSVLGGVLSLALFCAAAYALLPLVGKGGPGLIVVALLAVIVGGFGALVALGVVALNYPRFPSVTTLSVSAVWALVIIAGGVARSLLTGQGGPSVLTAAVWVGLAAVAGTLLWLLGRPSTTEWVKATAQQSVREGHVPARRRR
jgi:hypothetical protein